MTANAPTLGRPKTRPDLVFRSIEDSKLCALLESRLPQFLHRKRLKVGDLAERLGVTRSTIYHWMNHDYLSLAGAKALIEVSVGTITKEDLAPFVETL